MRSTFHETTPICKQVDQGSNVRFLRCKMPPKWFFSLFGSKDWWAVWISAFLFVPSVAIGLSYRLTSLSPKQWKHNPLDAWTDASQILGFFIITIYSAFCLSLVLTMHHAVTVKKKRVTNNKGILCNNSIMDSTANGCRSYCHNDCSSDNKVSNNNNSREDNHHGQPYETKFSDNHQQCCDQLTEADVPKADTAFPDADKTNTAWIAHHQQNSNRDSTTASSDIDLHYRGDSCLEVWQKNVYERLDTEQNCSSSFIDVRQNNNTSADNSEIDQPHIAQSSSYLCPQRRTSAFGRSFLSNITAISGVSLLALVAQWLGEQKSLRQFGLTFELWALLFGMLVSNTKLMRQWLEPGCDGEFFIKVGLVLLGLDLRAVAALGGPGLLASWIPTPLVIVISVFISYRVLKMWHQRDLVLVLVAGTSICGSSAATAIHGCVGDGDPEMLTLSIAIINLLTIPQMIAIPYFAFYVGIATRVAGAWMGASIDATGAVVAAAGIYDGLAGFEDCSSDGDDECAVDVASTVKMVQNILIGPVAIGMSMYWLRYGIHHDGRLTATDNDDIDDSVAEKDQSSLYSGAAPSITSQRSCVSSRSHEYTQNSEKCSSTAHKQRPSLMAQLWDKFPKFVLGFILFSGLLTAIQTGADKKAQSSLRVTVRAVSRWFFGLGFVGIGLSTNIRKLGKKMQNGSPLLLYLVCQLIDLALKYAFAALSFSIIE
eukprot:gene6545-9387_t